MMDIVKIILDNYKKIYIELVSPKIVHTAIDNNPGFFKLKAVSNKPIYISDQNGMSKVADSHKQKSFYGDLKKYTKENKKMPEADNIFLFGKNDRDRISKTIKGYPVSFMKNVPKWHYRSPNKIEYLQAIKEINNL